MTITRDNLDLYVAIAERTEALGILRSQLRIDRMMDLEYADEYFNLDLPGLLAAPCQDFIHDVVGITHHIDRNTKTFGGCFVPRFARPEQTAEEA